MPVYLLVVFGCYSLATVGYRVATFNDCEDAAKELQAQIKEAKADLKKKGLKMWELNAAPVFSSYTNASLIVSVNFVPDISSTLTLG